MADSFKSHFNVFTLMLFSFILFLLSMVCGLPVTQAASKQVYVIPIDQDIEQGLYQFMLRGFNEAEKNGADAIFLSINTPGGEVTAAGQIGELIRKEKIPVYAFIQDEAFSAGTYIALNASKIIMTPGSAMGSAAPITMSGNMADKKVVAAWTKKMTSAAEMHGRNPEIAQAMVDPEIDIPNLSPKGQILSLDPQQAIKVGYADYLANDFNDALRQTGFEHASVIIIKPTVGERVARFVTSPFVTPILLTLGLVGIVIEFLIPGFGLPGVIGVISFVLYFFGQFIAGFAEWLHIIFFILGILLLLIEVFVPGFGIFGGIGMISVFTGIVMAAYDTSTGLESLGIAIVITLIVVFLAVKYFGYRGVWNKFILREQLNSDQGYLAAKTHRELIGKRGLALTALRPAGSAEIEGRIIDVVTGGMFIEKGSMIQVEMVQGNRVVVREIK